ncbi:MAG: uroporphyrinogen decarboxylase family protein [Bacteroidota bacterium]
MTKKGRNASLNDEQTTADSIKVIDFDFDTYQEYAQKRTARCEAFMRSRSGVLVFRQMYADQIFTYGCRDMQQSLEWQLGSLQKSLAYKSDVPNYLEPWYGIGPVSGSFGIDYIWYPDQAPLTKPAFQSIDEALAYDIRPVKESEAGKHSLRMIEYFLEQTKGKLPMSMGDIQSPFDNATSIVDASSFFLSLITEPDKVLSFLDLLADLEIEFYREQEKLIGDALVRPGHGFASSGVFQGFGISDDNIVMIDANNYLDYIAPSFIKLGAAFGGPVLHSCGNYSDKAQMLNSIEGLRMVDGAFTTETDPDPNPASPFADALTGSGITLNARIKGDPISVKAKTEEIWQPGMKLIVVTYAQSPEEQAQTYEMIKEICI